MLTTGPSNDDSFLPQYTDSWLPEWLLLPFPSCWQLAPTHRGIAFHDSKIHKQLITGISDIPMNQTPMDGSLVENFPDGSDFCHASSLMDGPDLSRISRLVMSQIF